MFSPSFTFLLPPKISKEYDTLAGTMPEFKSFWMPSEERGNANVIDAAPLERCVDIFESIVKSGGCGGGNGENLIISLHILSLAHLRNGNYEASLGVVESMERLLNEGGGSFAEKYGARDDGILRFIALTKLKLSILLGDFTSTTAMSNLQNFESTSSSFHHFVPLSLHARGILLCLRALSDAPGGGASSDMDEGISLLSSALDSASLTLSSADSSESVRIFQILRSNFHLFQSVSSLVAEPGCIIEDCELHRMSPPSCMEMANKCRRFLDKVDSEEQDKTRKEDIMKEAGEAGKVR